MGRNSQAPSCRFLTGKVVEEWTSAAEAHMVEGLKAGETYTLKEVAVPDGYTFADEITFTIDEKGKVTTTGSATADESGIIVLLMEDDKIPLTEIEAQKVWEDQENKFSTRPESITFHILRNGEIMEGMDATVTAKENWKYTWTDLYSTDELGNKYVYTVKEEKINGYSTEYSEDTLTVKNILEMTEITVNKVWEDDNNRDGIRPESITLHILQNGTEMTDLKTTVTEQDGWSYTWKNLPETDSDGNAYTYTVKEDDVEGYTAQYSEDTLTITNTHEIELTKLHVTKLWSDADNQDGLRPETITLAVLADGKETEVTLTLSAADGWTGATEEVLPKYKDQGVEIVYTVKEAEVEGYTSVIVGTTDGSVMLQNEHTPELIDIPVKKVWNDDHDRELLRPETITVTLLADDAVIDHAILGGESDTWVWTFTGLDKYRDGGVEIQYTIEELEITGYTSTLDGNADEGFTLTNTHEWEVISIPVKKVWNDGNDRDHVRPVEVKVDLYSNGKLVKDKVLTLTAENDWKGEFTDLPKYENGVEITYTVHEQKVKSYSSKRSGDMKKGFTITNYHTPGTGETTGDEIPIWPFILGGTGILALVAALVLNRKRRVHKPE